MPTLSVRRSADVPTPERRLRPIALLKRMADGRWFCRACMAAFEAEEMPPVSCPEGHRA